MPDARDKHPDIDGVSPADAAIVALAERQHGVVAFRQLEALGFRRGAVEHRLAAGRLHRRHKDVYAVGRPSLTTKGHWMAAVLACGPGAALSHRSAAALWGIGRDGWKTDVSVPGDRRSRGMIKDLERDFEGLIRKAALADPQMNVILEGFEVDAFWPPFRLVVELDSRGYHLSPRAFENDRARDATLQRAGYRVIRLTGLRLRDDPSGVVELLAELTSGTRPRRSAAGICVRRPAVS